LVKDKEKSNYFIYGMETHRGKSWFENFSNEGYYLEWNNKQNIYSCSLKLNIQNSIKWRANYNFIKMNFIRSLGYFIPA
jgi:hypothetical protein